MGPDLIYPLSLGVAYTPVSASAAAGSYMISGQVVLDNQDGSNPAFIAVALLASGTQIMAGAAVLPAYTSPGFPLSLTLGPAIGVVSSPGTIEIQVEAIGGTQAGVNKFLPGGTVAATFLNAVPLS